MTKCQQFKEYIKRNITIQIVTHRVDWFSCLAFVLLHYTPARLSDLIF